MTLKNINILINHRFCVNVFYFNMFNIFNTNVNSNLGIVISYQNGISLTCLMHNVNSNLGIVISYQNGIS